MFDIVDRSGEKRIRIGPKEFKLGVCDKPLPDGTYLGVETAGRPYSTMQEQFNLELLKGAFASQLPKGLYIGVEDPIVEARHIQHIELKNPYGNPILVVALSYDYASWEYDSNLMSFCKHLSETILKNIAGCTAAKSTPDDATVFISLYFDIPRSADLYNFVHSIDKQIDRISREAVLSVPGGAVKPSSTLKPDEQGYKWWVRYVLIPLAGSAAVIAIVRSLLSRG